MVGATTSVLYQHHQHTVNIYIVNGTKDMLCAKSYQPLRRNRIFNVNSHVMFGG